MGAWDSGLTAVPVGESLMLLSLTPPITTSSRGAHMFAKSPCTDCQLEDENK
jgi:hypothetical protein